MNINDMLQEILRLSRALEFAIQVNSPDKDLLKLKLRRLLRDALKGTFVEESTRTISDSLFPENDKGFSLDQVIRAVERWIEEGRPPRQFRGQKLCDEVGM